MVTERPGHEPRAGRAAPYATAPSGSTRAGDPMSDVERRRRDAGIDILARIDRPPETGDVPETVEPRGREDGGEFRIVQQILFDRAPRDVRSDVLAVRQVPDVRRDVIEGCTGVAEPRDVHVHLARPHVLHDRGRARPERFFDRTGELDW